MEGEGAAERMLLNLGSGFVFALKLCSDRPRPLLERSLCTEIQVLTVPCPFGICFFWGGCMEEKKQRTASTEKIQKATVEDGQMKTSQHTSVLLYASI